IGSAEAVDSRRLRGLPVHHGKGTPGGAVEWGHKSHPSRPSRGNIPRRAPRAPDLDVEAPSRRVLEDAAIPAKPGEPLMAVPQWYWFIEPVLRTLAASPRPMLRKDLVRGAPEQMKLSAEDLAEMAGKGRLTK